MTARILIVDDSAIAGAALAEGLRDARMDAVVAADLASMDEALRGAPFSLVLVDWHMPEMFGDDVVEFLRSEKGVTAPMWLYSDQSDAELEAAAARVGAAGYLSKQTGVPAAVAAVGKAVGAPKRAWRVLVVDDNETTGKILGAELEGKGFEVLVADSADAATRIVLKKKTRPDLILLDVRMPDVSGDQFCRFIKNNSVFAGIKVLLCSALEEPELKRLVADAGADGYVTKDALMARALLKSLE